MNKKPKNMKWLVIAVISFLVFVLLQVPASWLISKFYKDNQVLQNVSGNIWQGQADWRKGEMRGSIIWKTRPLDLILLRAAANIEIFSGKTQLKAIMGYGINKKVIVRDLQGQISPETLKAIINWQWPANQIQLKDVQLDFKKQQGFSSVQGELQWAGGELVYTFADRQDQMNMPSLNGQLQDVDGKLQFNIQDQRKQKMANIMLDPNMMLDVQLTQRLLMNVPSYDGKAGLDTFVVSTRKPLMQGGS
ncbi:type II secretion system protein N [Acinetobacter rudis]|uniref:Type II secretion system protein N n=1 Tax=Acinetobacter rudis TaxID=632955 RepID=A0AAW8J8X6_9GAMM|nr:type II secretion system protein N [Acinetobacter rudis]MDQ8935953.1 type II secretion system protein N [Acinetobacter rudis]MDQ8953602.1 type II secretion system protein N [Acinetobacter rudis]MDQ9018216.1 type II secretion system protein N [Acinetobacter rudis]